jgi:hypothetical protein
MNVSVATSNEHLPLFKRTSATLQTNICHSSNCGVPETQLQKYNVCRPPNIDIGKNYRLESLCGLLVIMSMEGGRSLDLPAQLLMAPGIDEAIYLQIESSPSPRGTHSLVLLIRRRLRVKALWPWVENA